MLAVMAVAALTASAQSGEFHITPHVNLGYAYLSNVIDEFDELRHNIVGGFGADAEYMLTDEFGISGGLDLNYMESGKSTYKDKEGEAESYNKYMWLNVPILAQYHIGNFALKAGIQPVINLSADEHTEISGSGININADDSFSDNVKTVGLAIPVGVSYTFDVPVTVDLRCAIPVTGFSKDLDLSDDGMLTPITVSVGYRF